MEKEINEYILRFQGGVNLSPEDAKKLEFGKDIKIEIIGGLVEGDGLKDNHDGTYDKKFVIKPIEVKIL